MRHISFAGSAASLLEHGAVFNITLLPDPMVIREMAQRDEPIVSATVPMLLDTGADRTVVEQQVAEKMGLTPIRFAEMRGVNQKPELYPLYLMMLRLHVEDGLRAGAVDFRAEVVGMPSPPVPQPHVGLLGRDFLRVFYLTYHGGTGRVELTALSELTGSERRGQKSAAPPAIKSRRKSARQARKKARGR